MAQSEIDDTGQPREAEPAQGTPRQEVVEQHARAAFDALARRDAEAIGEHWREDAVSDIVPIGILRGRREIVEFYREAFAAVPDLDTTVTRVVAGERLAAVEWRMTGNFTGAFRGIDPTGKRIELRGVDLLEIDDGEILSNSSYYDVAAFARQVGMLPPEDSSAGQAMKSVFNAVTRVRKAVAERTGSG